MRNLFYENSLKMKSLNEENFQIFQGIQKHVFLHQKDIVKANILLSTILDQMNDETQKINLKKGMKNYVSQVEKSINMKEKMKIEIKKAIDKFTIAGLWETMTGYIVLLFFKEFIIGHYLISFSIDLLVAIISFYIAIHNIVNQFQLLKRFQMPKKIQFMIIATFLVGFITAILGAKNPFDVSFLVLVIGYITSKKMFENEMKK
jgi:hypothetical protein